MRYRLALLVLGACLWASAQSRMTVNQLVEFVKSSIQLKQPDREVAKYIGKLTLGERLEDRTIEELEGLGAGPKTSAALRTLAEASKSLPAPGAPVVVEQPKPPQIPPPSPADQQRVLREARQYALSYTKRLPDFMCTQVTRRFFDPSGLEFWHAMDTIVARLSYFEQKEDYKVVLVNSRPVNTNMYALGGATSTGEFGSLLSELFEPKTETDFAWERWATLRGRRTHVFRYHVEQPKSQWHVNWEHKEDTVPGYHGLVYVDNATNSVVRVTLEAELPPSFPIQAVSTVLDYDFTSIGENPYLLPLKAVVRMREGKLMTKNDVEFRMYRKFSAEAQIKWDLEDTPPPLPEEKTKEQPPK